MLNFPTLWKAKSASKFLTWANSSNFHQPHTLPHQPIDYPVKKNNRKALVYFLIFCTNYKILCCIIVKTSSVALIYLSCFVGSFSIKGAVFQSFQYGIGGICDSFCIVTVSVLNGCKCIQDCFLVSVRDLSIIQ